MSDFKKLDCGVNCPTKTGFTDCEGAPILSNATLATCADLEKLDPDKPVEPTEYCPSVRMACAGSYGYGYGPDDIKDPAATVEMKACDNEVVCYIYPTSAAGHTIAIKDCDGVLVGYSANASQCAGGSLVTISGTQATGNVIATIKVDGIDYTLKETLTSITEVVFDDATRTLTITYKGEDGVEVTEDVNIPAIDAVIHIAPTVITPPTLYPQYFNTIVTDANGNFWAFSIDGTPTLLNIVETVTTIIDVLTYANKHEIFKYKNEAGFIKAVFETVTSVSDVLTSGTKIGTFNAEDGTTTDIFVPTTSLVSLSGMQATGHTIGTISIDGTSTAIKETVTVVTGVQATGKIIGTYKNEAGVDVNVRETVTTMTGTQATGKVIGTYTNEDGTPVIVRETITTLKSMTYNKVTGILTTVYTDETGTDITKTASIVAQATAFINGTNPATATIFSLTSPPTVNDNTLKNNEDYVYVGTDGSTWYWNGTAYVTAPVLPATTEWLLAGTAVDAKGDKTNKIARTGWVTIGRNLVASAPLDVYNTDVAVYSVIGRFLNPNNKVAGNHTQLIFGAAQESGNAADWRFHYAGNNSGNNRIDFAFSGYAAPNISYLVNGRTGVRTTAPTSTFDVNGTFALPGRLSPGGSTMNESDFLFVMSSATSVTVLPDPATMEGRLYAVKNNSGGVSSVTGKIDFAPTAITISLPSKASRVFQALGGTWVLIAGYL